MKNHLVSAIITFVSSFLTTLAASIILIPTEAWTSAGWESAIAALVLTAVRAAVKPALERYLVTQ